MCGIVALFKHRDLARPLSLARAMSDDVIHRGPDSHGCIGFDGCAVVRESESAAWQVALAHRRLSIIDSGRDAAQPMGYRQRYWITYNGEVYNYLELRRQLQRLGHAFRTHSDSEVVLAAFAEWGPDCFERMRGMWSLVLLDTLAGTAVLCRDRMGIKPLYTWRGAGVFAVVSEIKQLRRLPGFVPRLSQPAMAEYLATGYEDPLRSFFSDVVPVPAGTYQMVSTGDGAHVGASRAYWWPERITASIHDASQAGEAFAGKLAECVEMQLRSDVPVGCAVSGGLDSSAIAVLMAERYRPTAGLQSFTSLCTEDGGSERAYVDAVLERIHAVSHVVEPSAQGLLEDLRDFVWHHEEPVSSLSMYAGYCVARAARRAGIPVMLNGEGGDEVLCGYWQSYFLYLRDLGTRGRVFRAAAHFAGALLAGGNPLLVRQVPRMLRRYAARRRGFPDAGGPLAADHVLQRMLSSRGQARRVNEIRLLHLPRLLKWGDRNLMAFSIEGRYPFLDHELIELCLSLAPETLYHRGWTKWPLRTGLEGRLPQKVARRRSKFGFWVPQERWLCGPLRSTLTAWLTSDRPLWERVDRAAVRRLAEATWQAGRRRDEPGQALVRCFMLDQWLEVFDVVT